jgi:transcriptional regulator with XRE-family HTH domain
MLAGVSIDYYTQLERGKLNGVSETVLDAIARALQLDEAERSHLSDLARAVNKAPHVRRPLREPVRPGVRQILDAMVEAPAFVRNGWLDVLYANQLGRALYSEAFASPVQVQGSVNLARYRFLDPGSADFYPDWEESAMTPVALLRTEAGRNPYNKALSSLIGQLCTQSEEFRVRWAAHDVRVHRNGVKHFRHPVVGDLKLSYEAMNLAADPGLQIIAYSAEAGTSSHDALKLLASWSAMAGQADEVKR